jgi:hypothetical protein
MIVMSTLTVWQLEKYRLRCRRRLLLSSRQAQEHIKNCSYISDNNGVYFDNAFYGIENTVDYNGMDILKKILNIMSS